MDTQSLDHFECIELHEGDLERHVPEISFQQPTLKDEAAAYLAKCNEILKDLHDRNYHSAHLLSIRSLMMDRLVTFIFQECEREVYEKTRSTEPSAAIVAQGGFGRKEMNVHSDIDLLFIYPKKKGPYIETLTEKMLYIFWDLKLEVGYATRTVTECRKLMSEDVTVMTALLDARLLCGNGDFFDNLQSEINSVLSNSSTQKKFIQQKLQEKKSRIAKHGGSVFVLEPNVKESAGSLRDLQTPLWLSKIQGRPGTYEDLLEMGFLREEEFRSLMVARNFLWRIRNEIHFMVGRKVDQMTFQRQEVIAPKMGYAESDGILAVEKFMQAYYKMAYQVSTITDALIRRMTNEEKRFSRLVQKFKIKKLDDTFRLIDGQIAVKNTEVFQKDPVKMMEIFKWVQDKGLAIHPGTKDCLRMSTELITDEFRINPKAVALFRSMLNKYENLGMTLLAMHDVHFLDEWMPEFKKLRCRVQHDIYHIYTIDTHSIFAVNELSKLVAGEYKEKFDFYHEVIKQVQRPELLTLGLFLHDIGKGEGGNHSVRGAAIAEPITKRLGYTEEEKKSVEFLIISHLMMPHLSQRRDLEDQELIIKFARSMGTMDNLNMLLLLTWGDIRAVGPEAWTDWKGTLLQTLYEKTNEVITKGEFSKEKTQERIIRVKENLMNQIGDRYSRDEFQKFMSIMPPRYFFVATDKEIERHFKLYKQAEEQTIVSQFQYVPEENINEVVIYTLNAPHVLSRVAGVMLAYAVNIFRMELFQTTDGHILVMLKVTDAAGKALKDISPFEKVKESLGQILTGKMKVQELISRRQVPEYLTKKPLQKADTRVIVDNDVSAYSTVIDVYAHDRLGLLYDIIRTLNDQGCFIEVSKISTKVEQVTDVFYVKDVFGMKITSKEKLKNIKHALLHVIENRQQPESQPPVQAQVGA